MAGLRVGKSFSAIPVPEPPIIRKGASGSFYDKGLKGASHHAVIPNVNTVDELREIWSRLSIDEKKLFDVVARAYLAAIMPDFRYRQTTATLDVPGGSPFPRSGSPAHRSRVARGIPRLATGGRKGRRRTIAACPPATARSQGWKTQRSRTRRRARRRATTRAP